MFGSFSNSFFAGRRPAKQDAPVINSNTTGLQSWYDASDITQFKPTNPSNGTGITQWTDKSAFAHNASPSGAGTGVRPTYQTNVLNGLSVVRFDGVAQNLNINPVSWISGSGFTILMVAKTTADVNINPITSTDKDGLKIFHSGSRWGVRTSGGTGMSALSVDTGSFHTFTFIYDGTQSTNATRLKFRYDRQDYPLTFTGTVGNSLAAGTSQFNIGIDASGSYFKGDVAEMTLFSRTLAPYEITNVENYLKTHWGL
jgi:hypothetical protein